MLRDRQLIAVIDDDMPFVELMHELMSDEGYRTVSCLDGSQAHAVVRANAPDLVILDMQLQEHERGLAVLDGLRADPTTAGIPIIICSASTHLLNVHEARLHTMGCVILHKPFDIDALLDAVRQSLAPPDEATA